MAPNDREERRRMRQRGAGAQQLPNVNFGFTFGAPPLPPQQAARQTPQQLPSRPSSRQTPQQLPPQSSSRKTPAGSSAKLSAKSSKRRISASVPSSVSTRASRSKPTKAPSVKSPPLFVTPTVAGKRKRREIEPRPIEEDSGEDELQTDDEQFLASSQKKKPAAKAKLTTVEEGKWSPEDDDLPDELSFQDEELQASMEKNRQERLSKSVTPVAIAASRPARSNAKPSHNLGKSLGAVTNMQTPVQRLALRKSIPKPTASRESAKATEVEEENSEDEISPNRTEQVSTELGRKVPMDVIINEAGDDGVGDEDEREHEIADLDEEESMDELSPDYHRKRPPADQRRSQTETPAPRTKARADVQEEAEEDAQDEGVEEDSTQPGKEREAIRTRLSHPQRSTSTPRSPITGPIPIRRPKTKTTGSKSKGARQKRQKGDDKRVTIAVYRITYPYEQLRAAGTEEDEERMRAATRIPGVSGIDVLTQITDEILSARIENLHEKSLDVPASNPALRSELKRKRGIVQNFNSSLSDRLLELQEAVDTGSALRNRLKDALKEKLRLREEFLATRRQREDLSRKMDEMRAAHVDRVRKMKEMNEVNTAMSDIETAIQRGREHAKQEGREEDGPDVPIDLLLERVAMDVRSDGGGLFDRVKAFNGRLERTAQVLEGRA